MDTRPERYRKYARLRNAAMFRRENAANSIRVRDITRSQHRVAIVLFFNITVVNISANR